MDLTFHIERDWKTERIEREKLVSYDFFHWMELVNLMLGANIKSCLSYVDVKDPYLLSITNLKVKFKNVLLIRKMTAILDIFGKDAFQSV